VISKFPQVVIEDMNCSLSYMVLEPEVMVALSLMQKGKILRPDGFTVEFFLGFYDLLKENLLKVFRESQQSGKMLGSFNSKFISLILKK